MATSGLPVYNVKTDYSAAGNGTADDSAAIQNAINAASAAGGGTVFFPAGTYKISRALELKSNVHLLGEAGDTGTKLKPVHASYAITGVDITANWFEIGGTSEAVTSITRSGSVATVTTPYDHGFSTGQSITISGATQTEYNGTFTITVIGATSFTYTVTGTPATPATGTITAAGTQVSRAGEFYAASTYQAARTFAVAGSTGNNGQWTVSSVSYNSGTGKTRITVTGDITNATADGSIGAHLPAIRHIGSAITGWTVKNLFIDFDSCKSSSDRSGVASTDNNDIGIALTSNFLYEIEKVRVQYAYYAYNGYYLDGGNPYMGKLSDVWSIHCRNGFRHVTGTVMEFNRCWAHYWDGTYPRGNVAVGSDMERAFELKGIWGVTLNDCAVDCWAAGFAGVLIEGCHGAVVNGMDTEFTNIQGGQAYWFLDSDVVMQGCSDVGTRHHPNASGDSYFIRSSGGSLAINGCRFGQSEAPAVALGGDASSRAITLVTDGAIDSALTVNGSIIQEPNASFVLPVVSITRSGSTATVTTGSQHGLTTGDSITIAGAVETAYNGTYTITVTSATAFTYTVAGTPSTPATGTITATTVAFSGSRLAFVDNTTTGSGEHKTAILGTAGIPSRITDDDATAYSPENSLLFSGGISTETFGVASRNQLVNVNLYASDGGAVVQRRATLQAIRGGSSNNGGHMLFFTKSDASPSADVVQAGYIGVGGGGLVWGTPTGGDKGAGTINASAVYDDGTLLTDWVFDLAYDGKSDLPHARQLHSLPETMEVTRAERRLPWMPSAAEFEEQRGIGNLISRLIQGQEQQQLYIAELEARIAALEAAVNKQ